jgi:WD40 repeat protein
VRFRDTVADIAAAIRGVPKDELASEEVRQHRRTIRTAWTAGVAILALGIAATVGAIVAFNAQQEAEDNAAIAQEERDRAVAAEDTATEERDRANQLADQEAAARAEAEQQRTLAEEQAEIAEANADLARSRELAAASQASLQTDPELSILLALEAVSTATASDRPSILETVTALRQGVASSRIVDRIGGSWFVDYSPDGALLVTGLTGPLGEREDAAIWHAETGERLHHLPSPEGRIADIPWQAAFSPDGGSLAIGYGPSWKTPGESGPLVVLWDVATGEMVASFDDPSFDTALSVGFNPDGTSLVAETHQNWPSPSSAVIVWDVSSGSEQYRIDHGVGHYARGPSLDRDGRLLAVLDGAFGLQVRPRIVLYEAGTGVEVSSFEVPEGWDPLLTAFDPAGRRLAVLSQELPRLGVWDVESGSLEMSRILEGIPQGVEWNPSGQLVAVSGNEGTPRLYDADTGDLMLTLRGQNAIAWDLSFDPTGERLAAAGFFSDTIIWDVGSTISREVESLTTPFAWIVGLGYLEDGSAILVNGIHQETGYTVASVDPNTGAVLAAFPDQYQAFPAGPRVFPDAGVVASVSSEGAAALHEGSTFESITSVPEGFYAIALSNDRTHVVLNPIQDEGQAVLAEVGSWETVATLESPPQYAFFNPTGDRLMAGNQLIDVGSGAVLADLELGNFFMGRFSPNGQQIAFHTSTGGLLLLDVAAIEAGGDRQQSLLWEINAHNGPTSWSNFSPDGKLISSMGFDNYLRVWDVQTGDLVADFGAFAFGHAFHPNGEHLIVGDTDGTIQFVTLDTNELVGIARSRITRGFTDDECATYHIDPCPDLETIEGGG